MQTSSKTNNGCSVDNLRFAALHVGVEKHGNVVHRLLLLLLRLLLLMLRRRGVGWARAGLRLPRSWVCHGDGVASRIVHRKR